MAWYKVIRNARVGRARYLTGAVVELDPATLKGKEDNFAACAAPTDVKPVEKKKAAPKAEAKAEAKVEHVEPKKIETEYKATPKTDSWLK